MKKPRRVYQPRVVGGHVMLQADLERLHKYILEIERIDEISDEMRRWWKRNGPSSATRLPPREPQD